MVELVVITAAAILLLVVFDVGALLFGTDSRVDRADAVDAIGARVGIS